MKLSFGSLRKLAGTLAAVGAVVALTAVPAFADPPNHPLRLAQARAGLTHQPEILAGIKSPTAAQPAHVPEIIGGITAPAGQTAVSSQPGFDLGNLAIGLGSGLGLLFLTGGTMVVVRRRHREAAPSALLR